MLGVLVSNNPSERRTDPGSRTTSDGSYRHAAEQRAARGDDQRLPMHAAQIGRRTDAGGLRTPMLSLVTYAPLGTLGLSSKSLVDP